jgi:DNA-binding MarR family transcriptional regulator
VSSTVERLRVRSWIAQQPTSGDRRRNLWHLTDTGGDVVRKMLQAAHELRLDLSTSAPPTPLSGSKLGVAA